MKYNEKRILACPGLCKLKTYIALASHLSIEEAAETWRQSKIKLINDEVMFFLLEKNRPV